MTASVWRSKCPYNIADPEDLDPCPHCDADNPVPAPAVGHVCEGLPTARKSGQCWICGQALPHDCVGSAHEQSCWHTAWEDRQPGEAIRADRLDAVRAIVQSWLDKQGHDRCWYYPDLFNQLVSTLGLTQRASSELPPIEEFKEGCRRYQAEEYRLSPQQPIADRLDGFALLPDAQTTHGPPQKVDTIAAKLIEQKRDLAAALFSEPAKRLAPSIAPAGRKWPIGTIDDNVNANSAHWACRLQSARAHANLTLDALGAKLNPPRTRKDISAMEHGRRGLSVELCAQLADALDCDRLWLAGWTLEGAS